jgi:type I restriction enzyme, S subunit
VSWRDCKLGDVVKLQRGHDLPERNRVAGDVPIVSSSGITGRHNVAKADPPGVVTGRYGTIGEVFYIEEPYWPLNTALYVVDFKGNDPRYVAYLLRNTLKNYRSEKAAVPGVDRNVLHQLNVRVADADRQREIVTMISAYDDLIENNRRRIALMQEAARLLYREWFVYLRFPGHEHVKIADGLPEGWMRMPLGFILNLQRGFDLPLAGRRPGTVPVYGSTGIVGQHDEPKVANPTLITGRSGSLGVVSYVDEACWPLNTALWVTEFKAVSIFVAYFILQEMNLMKFGGGASVPTLDRKVVHAVPVVVPPEKLTLLFDEYVRDIFSQIKLLHQQSQKLEKARDLLLPRLMSGEIAA